MLVLVRETITWLLSWPAATALQCFSCKGACGGSFGAGIGPWPGGTCKQGKELLCVLLCSGPGIYPFLFDPEGIINNISF